MKTFYSIFLVSLFFIKVSYSQIQPTSSPYYNNGVYSLIWDSATVNSKKVLMYRPAVAPVNKYPVFIFQPGANGVFGGNINVHTYDLFLHHLASWGFVVLVIDETTAGMPSGTTFKSVHTWLKDKMADNTHWLYTYADPSKVVIGGHSNGGVNASGLLVERPTEIHGIVYFASYPSDNFMVPQDVSNYSGKVLSLAGSEDNSSTPSSCKNGYNAYTSASCKSYALITGLGHAGFGDYTHSSQVVGTIGRENATATIRHYFLSFMLGQFYNDNTAMTNLTQTNLQPNTTGEFLSNCGGTVSINKLNNNSNINIYPNPACDFINLSFDICTEGNTTAYVYDVSGRELLKTIVEPSKEFKIDIRQFQNGFYFLKIENHNKLYTTTFIKN